MSEENIVDTLIDELQAEPIQTDSKPIEDFLKAVEDQNFTQAERQFNDLIQDRLQDTLDQTKARIAASIGDTSEPEFELESESELELGADTDDNDEDTESEEDEI
jgi:hypothetical protein